MARNQHHIQIPEKKTHQPEDLSANSKEDGGLRDVTLNHSGQKVKERKNNKATNSEDQI